MSIFAAFFASELEPGQVILLPPVRRGDVVQSLEVTHVERPVEATSGRYAAVRIHHDNGVHTAYANDLIQVQVER